MTNKTAVSRSHVNLIMWPASG